MLLALESCLTHQHYTSYFSCLFNCFFPPTNAKILEDRDYSILSLLCSQCSIPNRCCMNISWMNEMNEWQIFIMYDLNQTSVAVYRCLRFSTRTWKVLSSQARQKLKWNFWFPIWLSCTTLAKVSTEYIFKSLKQEHKIQTTANKRFPLK